MKEWRRLNPEKYQRHIRQCSERAKAERAMVRASEAACDPMAAALAGMRDAIRTLERALHALP